jgi:hypothetical protein
MSHPCEEAIATITSPFLNQIIIYIWISKIWIPARILVNQICDCNPGI